METSLLNLPHPITHDVSINSRTEDCKYNTPDEFNSTFYNKVDNFSLLHINARSLNRNFDYFENLLQSLNNFEFSVIGISETWLHSSLPQLFNIPNYRLIRADRTERRGGGVAFYVHEKLTFRIRDDIKLEQAEALFIEVENPEFKNVIIGLIYRPPNTNFDMFYNTFEACLNNLINENKYVYFLGDFNINFLPSARNNNSDRFKQLIYSYGFDSLINKPTRINTHSSTQIDNIFCNIHNKKVSAGLLCSEVSDHIPIFCTCEFKNICYKTHDIHMQRKETEHNIQLFIQDLEIEDWANVYESDNVNKAYENLHDKLQYLYDKNIPLVRIKYKNNKPQNPWITKGILKSIKTRNRLYKIFVRNPIDANSIKYKTYRNKLTKIIRISRKLYFSRRLESLSSNTNATWKVLKEVMGIKTDPLPKEDLILKGDKIADSDDIPKAFNSFFTNVGPQLASKIDNTTIPFNNFLPERNPQSLFLKPTNANEIINITKSLKASKSQGYDNINTSLLKKIIYFIADPLSHIFNQSLLQGIYPNLFKISKVTPIFKKDDPHEISNYRPISILSSISKVLEKIVYNRLYNFLNMHNILNPNQYGFRKNHSTDLALVKIYDKITNAMANKEHVIGVFLDLSKAFDTLDHKLLLSKLCHYGIRGNALLWFRNYLADRKQYVSFNGQDSDILSVKCGVPQGSILGPLLFLLYINDITNTSPYLSFVLFADDTNIFYSNKNLNLLVTKLNEELVKVTEWFKCNKLSLNIKKTHFMYFKHANSHMVNPPININIDNKPIEQKATSTFLGVIIDEHLTWNAHLHHVATCMSKGLGIINKLKYILPQSTLFLLYNTLILPYITYCNIVWANCGVTKLHPILLLQKRAIRLCSGSDFLAHTNPVFCRFKILKVNDLNTFQVAIFMFKYINKQLPSSFNDLFILNNALHHYPTRIAGNVHLLNPRLLLFYKSIRHHGPDIWNNLPPNVKICSSLHSFKLTLKYNMIKSYADI